MNGRPDEPINIVYDTIKGKKINYLMEYKLRADAKLYNEIVKLDYGYCKYISNIFRIQYKIEEEYKENEAKRMLLRKYLEYNCEKVFYTVKSRDELIQAIAVPRGKSDKRLLKKIDTLNNALEFDELPYKIISFPTSKVVNSKQVKYPAAWKIIKVC